MPISDFISIACSNSSSGNVTSAGVTSTGGQRRMIRRHRGIAPDGVRKVAGCMVLLGSRKRIVQSGSAAPLSNHRLASHTYTAVHSALALRPSIPRRQEALEASSFPDSGLDGECI